MLLATLTGVCVNVSAAAESVYMSEAPPPYPGIDPNLPPPPPGEYSQRHDIKTSFKRNCNETKSQITSDVG